MRDIFANIFYGILISSLKILVLPPIFYEFFCTVFSQFHIALLSFVKTDGAVGA